MGGGDVRRNWVSLGSNRDNAGNTGVVVVVVVSELAVVVVRDLIPELLVLVNVVGGDDDDDDDSGVDEDCFGVGENIFARSLLFEAPLSLLLLFF